MNYDKTNIRVSGNFQRQQMKRKVFLLTLVTVCVSIILMFQYIDTECNDFTDLVQELNDKDTGTIRDEIIKDLKTKKILGVGESTHGTKEFYDLKTKILESFIEDDISVNILLEITIPDGQILDNYLNDSTESDVLKKINYTLLKNTSFKTLLDKCQQANNNNRKNKIRIYGIDPSYDQSLAEHLYERIMCSGPETNTPNELVKYFKNLRFNQLTEISIAQREGIKIKLVHLKESVVANADLTYILAIDQFLQAIRRLEVPIYSLESTGIRDSCMAKNIELIVSNHINEHNIIFAHNEHLRLNANSHIPSMGSYLNNSFRENYYPIAVEFIQGKYRVNDHSRTSVYYSKNNDGWLSGIVLNKTAPVFMKTNNKYFDRATNLHAIGGAYRSTLFKSENLMKEYRAIIIFSNGTQTQEID